MKKPRPSRLCPALLGLALALLHGQQRSRAQLVDEEQVKAAYIYNFLKFAEWPAEAFATPTDPIRLCVLDDSRFYSQVMHVVKDRTIAGRSIVAVPIHNADKARHCHLLFINSAHNGEVDRLFESLHGSNVLTIGETETFVDRGGIIGFVTQDSQVHFQVNHKAATQYRIRLSSRLLSVAKRVVE